MKETIAKHTETNYANKYTFPEEIQKSFNLILKQGIYKELHHRNLLTDAQLNSLLNNK